MRILSKTLSFHNQHLVRLLQMHGTSLMQDFQIASQAELQACQFNLCLLQQSSPALTPAAPLLALLPGLMQQQAT
jgi:hypothetical protein